MGRQDRNVLVLEDRVEAEGKLSKTEDGDFSHDGSCERTSVATVDMGRVEKEPRHRHLATARVLRSIDEVSIGNRCRIIGE